MTSRFISKDINKKMSGKSVTQKGIGPATQSGKSPPDLTYWLYDEAIGPKNLTTKQKFMDSAVDGVAMGVGVLVVGMGIRKIDKKLSPEASKVTGAKIVGGCVLASVLIQLLKSYDIIPSTYGHVMYRYNSLVG